MPIPLSITDLSATPASNSPQGTEPMGTNADDYIRSHAAIIRQIYDAIIAGTVVNLVPTGAIVMTSGTPPPTGWQVCDGHVLSRSTFSVLYAIIGTSYGVGDGSTTFNLPDLRGVFVRGLDNGRGLDANRALGSLQGNQMQAHTHTASESAVGDHAHSYTAPFSSNAFTTTGPSGTAVPGLTGSTTSPAGAHSHTITIAPAGAGSETRPVNVALFYIIKT